MIGLDTNVIVRYLVQDDPVQSAAASRVFEDLLSAENRGFVSAVVLCEVVWVLKRGYKVRKPGLCRVVRGLLAAEELELEHRDLVSKALARFEKGSADFSDFLIGERALAAVAAKTYSFDENACSCNLFESVPVAR